MPGCRLVYDYFTPIGVCAWSGWPTTPEKMIIIKCAGQPDQGVNVFVFYWDYLLQNPVATINDPRFNIVRERIGEVEYEVNIGFLLTQNEAALAEQIRYLSSFVD
jgi:hypothetical protein